MVMAIDNPYKWRLSWEKSTINGGLSIDMFDYWRVTNDHGDMGDMGLEFSGSIVTNP